MAHPSRSTDLSAALWRAIGKALRANKFEMPTTICAAGIAAMALTVSAAPQAQADETWGAIATGPNSQWRISFGQSDKSTAISAAKDQIVGGRLVLTFTDCAALVRNDSGFSAASGETRADAEGAALADLDGSWLVTWACNDWSGPGVNKGP
jgi:hypothetical protein